MTKIIVKNSFLTRLNNAAYNGNEIAKAVVAELKKPQEEVFNGKQNFFSLTYLDINKSLRPTLAVRYSSIDPKNKKAKQHYREDPDCVWKDRVSNKCTFSKFLGYFKNLPHYEESDIYIFSKFMAIPTKVHCYIGDTLYDFKFAYDGNNYTEDCDGEHPLLNSCMRYTNVNDPVAEFYAYVAHAKILIATDDVGQILGRAIIWPEVTLYKGTETPCVSVIDRMYYSFYAVRNIMLKYAIDHGVSVGKQLDSYDSKAQFVTIGTKEPEEFQCVATTKAHLELNYAGGAPYMDTFSDFVITEDTHEALLVNSVPDFNSSPVLPQYDSSEEDSGTLYIYEGPRFRQLAHLCSTSGTASSYNTQGCCPICGGPDCLNDGPCATCTKEKAGASRILCSPVVHTAYGDAPSFCMHKGKLTNAAKTSLLHRKLKRH